jgi:HlyD family secretion protein
VEASVVTWEGEDVLRVPSGALFRSADGGWAVFAVEGSRARLRTVEVGRRTPDHARVLGGLSAGDVVVLYPDDRLENGRRVAIRR